MGQPPTGARGSGRARWVIAASIAALLAASGTSLLLRDEGSLVATTRTARSSSEAPPATEPPTAAPAAAAAPAVADEEAPDTTSTTVAAPPRTAATPAPVDHGAPLRDQTFESVSVLVGSTERTFTDGATVRLQFEGTPTGDVIRWRIHCNTGGGRLTATADRLTVEETGSSAMSCGGSRDADDSWIGSFFGSDPAWALDGSRLTLRSGDTVIALEVVPAERFGP